MVQGINIFRQYFKNYTGQYVFIGGTACDVILGNEGVPFRQTKDLDIVLIIEALNDEFVNTFIAFIEEAGYEHINKGTGDNQFYRFDKPKNTQFPYMIELFSRKPNYLTALDTRLAPIHVDNDVVSLSAILLNDEYYSLLENGSSVINGVSVLNITSLILFKIKAWLDLSERKNKGEHVDSKSIRKHKNDIIRLVSNMEPGATLEVDGQIKMDVIHFLNAIKGQKADIKSLGIRNTTYEELLHIIEKCYDVAVL